MHGDQLWARVPRTLSLNIYREEEMDMASNWREAFLRHGMPQVPQGLTPKI